MTPLKRPPPRVALVHPYWDFWKHTAPAGFRASRLELARRLAGQVATAMEVATVAEVASPDEGAALAAKLGRVDAVLVLQTMAVPPAYVLGLLDGLPEAAVVVWAAHDTGLDDRFDHSGITTQGATVGVPMLTNALSRAERPFTLVLGRVDDAATVERVREALRAAGAAGVIRRSRLGRVGRPLEGYLHVDLDEAELREATGIEVVSISPLEVLERYRSVPDSDVTELRDELDAFGWRVDADVFQDDGLERSLRVAAALHELVVDHGLDAGAMNCHVPQIRFGKEIGVTPCFGLGRLTSLGIPWTCTGDMVTAVAMLTTKRLGGAALYHELETIDYATDEVVIANSGEHDLAWLAPGEAPRLARNGWFCGTDARCGVCAAFEPAPGPATLVGFTPHPRAPGGFRYVVARGELTPRRFPATGTPNGAFRFSSGPVVDAWVRWARAGVNHHASATPGDYSGAVAEVAQHLGVESVEV